MMKKFHVFILFLLPLLSVTAHAESVLENYYKVVSDKHDPAVKSGTCLIKGKLVDRDGGRIQDGVISTFNRSKSTVSDEDGNYSLTISSKDTSIFFYHSGYGEIVIWNYAFQSQHVVTIDFYTTKKTDYPVIQEKPVIYLYSCKPMDVALRLEHPSIRFTYPAYENGWSVKVSENGMLTSHVDGKEYPYLFWEGSSENLDYISNDSRINGFMINTDSAVHFLESSLTALGLNQKEQTDFITYWAPRLIQKQFAFVQFLVDEAYDATVAGLAVSPEPDAQRRVYMLFTPLDRPHTFFDHQPQLLSSFDRSGLTLVEWGGSEISNLPFLP
jgi:hypothetical protein